MELESYSRLTCNKLCASSNHVSTVKWSTSLTIDEFRWQQDQLLWRKFLSLEFEAKFQTEVPLFLELLEFPYNTVSHRSQEAVKQSAEFVLPFQQSFDLSRADTGPGLIPR